MRILVRESFRHSNGVIAANQHIDVFVRGTTTRPTLFSPNNSSTPTDNPVKTDAAGNAAFYIEEGSYDFFAFGLTVPFDAVSASEGGGADRYTHVQSTPSAAWTIHHNMGVALAPTVVLDSEPNSLAWTDMEIIDENTLALSFDSAVTGKAYL